MKKKFKRNSKKDKILKILKPKNASILPFLNFKALHTVGEFLYNVINENIKLNNKLRKNARCIVHKHRPFMKLLMTTEVPVLMMKNKLYEHPKIGKGIADLIATVTPGLIRRGTSTRSNIEYQLLDNEEDHDLLSDRIANDEWKRKKRDLVSKKQELLQSLAEKEELLKLINEKENELFEVKQ